MRITMVLPAFNLSGGIRVLAIYAERLQRRGHQVVAVAPPPQRPSLWEACKSLVRGRGWPDRSISEASHFDGLPLEHRLLDHPGRLRAADVPDADVIIATWWETAPWVADLPASKGAKVHLMQGYETFGGREEDVNAAYALPLTKIVISNFLRGVLQTKFGQTPVAVIPNAVDPERFHAPPRGKQATPTIGTLYHTLPFKGCATALEAYRRAAQVIGGLRLVAIGEMPVAAYLPLPQTAEFIHKARDQKLRDTYARCDAWLWASRLEGFGLPILEAMACRTPVIATPAGAAPELVSKGGGILVPLDDPEAMAQAVVQVVNLSDEEWRKMSDAALATATGYTWDDVINQMEEALQKVVQGKDGFSV